jgi:hypothetical protein
VQSLQSHSFKALSYIVEDVGKCSNGSSSWAGRVTLTARLVHFENVVLHHACASFYDSDCFGANTK